jgi:hypothetical protein
MRYRISAELMYGRLHSHLFYCRDSFWKAVAAELWPQGNPITQVEAVA